MKKQIKRFSKSTLAVVLSLCMLLSCAVVGIVATDAANMAAKGALGASVGAKAGENATVGAPADDSGSVGAKADESVSATGDWYIVGNVAGTNNWSERDAVKFSAVTGGYSITIALEKDKDFRLRHNSTDYGAESSSDSDRKVNSSTTDHTLSTGNQTFIWTGSTGTYTVTINSDGSKISFDGSNPGGGGGGGGDPEPDPSGDTTTDTANSTSGKTLLVAYHSASKWTHAHIWYNDNNANIVNGATSAGAMSTVSGYTGLVYKDITTTIANDNGNRQINFIVKNGTGWNDFQSPDVKESGFVKGKQWCYYTTTDSATSGTSAEYTPLKITTIERPTTITKNVASSFTVNVDGGLPWFYKDKLSTDKNYTLSVGTSSGGTQVVNAQTFNYTAKKYDFNWTPSSSGSVTLYFTLTDGIDTVTYSKAYTVVDTACTSVSLSQSPANGAIYENETAVTYTATATGAQSEVTYNFKVDGTSVQNTSSTTYTTTFTSAGTKSVTVTVEKSGYGSVTSSAVSTEVISRPAVYLLGLKNDYNWDVDDTNKMTYNPSTSLYEITRNLYQGSTTYGGTNQSSPDDTGFKVYDGGFYGSSAGYTINGMSYNNTTLASGDSTKNVCLTTKNVSSASSSAVPYKFTYNRSNHKVTVYYPMKVTYNMQDHGTNPSANGYVVAYGSTITAPTAPTADGYDFGGWYKEAACTNAWNFSTDTVTEDTVLYAKWTAQATHTITVNTNDSRLGTASASVAAGYQGQTITLTATESTGTFSNWTVNSGGVTVSGNTKTATFTMGSSNVTITANFTAYTPTDSDYYYNGYKLSNGTASTYGDFYAKRMTTGMIDGQVYSYYKVDGRSDTEQLLTVSKESPKYNSWDCFFEIKSSWESAGVKAQFYATDGNNLGDWANMTYVSTANEKKKFKIAIPDGARSVKFKNGAGSDTTNELFFTSGCNAWYNSGSGFADVTGYNQSNPVDSNFYEYFNGAADYTADFNTIGFYNHNANRGASHTFSKPKDNTNPYYIVVLEPNTTYTINGVTKTTDSSKPMVLCMTELPGLESSAETVKIYAKDGAIRRDNDTPERNNRTYSYFEQHANTMVYSDSACTNHIGTRSSYDGQTGEGSSSYNGYTYDYVSEFEKGQTFYIKTTLDSTLSEHHYLVAYSINGKCYQLHSSSEGSTVTESFTVPEDWEDKYIEITPIYFPKDASNCITFYVEGYDETVMNAGWGNTPYVYPFYQDQNYNYVGNINNAFGGYPGQPLVFYKGNYYTMLPKEYSTIPESGGSTINCTIKGVTIGNGYWDDIHFHIGEVTSHFQTYDYDDLYKIYKEYPDQADHIICSFKYRTKKNNDEPGDNPTYSNYNSTNGNGWELLTDYYGRPVDVFGNLLTDSALSAAEAIQNAADPAAAAASASGVVHVISQDYKSNSAGEYGTEWAIYNPSGTKIVTTGSGAKTTIVPSALAISDTSHFTNYDAATRAFQGIYDKLKLASSNVVGQPVVITYEKSIYGGSDKADRCDARWSYSTKGEDISAKTMIEYTNDGKTWNTDTYTSGTGTGSYTGAQAYFTGKAATAVDTPTDTTDVSGKNTTELSGTVGGGYYTFSAEGISGGTHGNYEFVGWYLLRDNYQNISSRSDYGAVSVFPSHAEQSKNGDIFVARFKKTATGTFDIHHELHPQTSGYGNVYVEAVLKESDGTQVGSKYGSIDGGTLTSNVSISVSSGTGRKIEAKFKAVAYPTSEFENFFATPQSLLNNFTGYAYIDSISIEDNIATVVYDVDKLFSTASGSPVQTVTDVTHYSKFSLRDDLTYNLTYTFNTRYYGTKLYKYTNATFTANELKSFFRSQIEDPSITTITIDPQFVQRKAPFESNFREDLTWNVDRVTCSGNTGSLTATQEAIEWANAVVYDLNNAGTVTTTRMAAPMEKLFDKDVHDVDASLVANWNNSCTDDQLYRPLRTTYVDTSDNDTVKPLYLDHWEAYQLDSFTYDQTQLASDGINLKIDTGKSTLVCKTYSSKFNYIGYEDYAIVPIYSKTPVNRQSISDNRTDCSATLLTITRNHWNETASGNAQGGKYTDSADRLYVDFMLNYNYTHNGQNVKLSTTGDNIKVGFIVKSYTIVYVNNEGRKEYREGKSQVVLVDKSAIDNKNRIEYCYGFNNSENNSQYGLNFEFTPFIIDTSVTGAGDAIILPNNGGTYNSLYSDAQCLDGVNFYMIGKPDTAWSE